MRPQGQGETFKGTEVCQEMQQRWGYGNASSNEEAWTYLGLVVLRFLSSIDAYMTRLGALVTIDKSNDGCDGKVCMARCDLPEEAG